MSVPRIFDPAARIRARDRAAARYADHAFFHDWMLAGVADRLASVRRAFSDVLDLGCADGRFALPGARPGAPIVRTDPGPRFAAAAGGVRADEDALPFAPASFDLIVSVGTLDTVDDLPGALAQIRRTLRPGGLFLAAFAGGGSLPQLRAALRAADPATARLHPQVDVRAGGDLLQRAGFVLPVADVEVLTVRYAGLAGLLADLRGAGAGNVLRDRRPLTRGQLAAAEVAFATGADADGRVSERFSAIQLTGWVPDA